MSPLILPLVEIGAKLLDKIIPDPEARDKAKLELLKQQQEGAFKELEAQTELALKQIDVNKAEAENGGWFRAGWRPAVGWICALGMGYQIMGRPFMWFVGQNVFGWTHAPTALETDTLMTLLFGMLGLGAYRTGEKIKGLK